MHIYIMYYRLSSQQCKSGEIMMQLCESAQLSIIPLTVTQV